VAPGEIVTIFGTGLGPDSIAYAQYDGSGYLRNTAAATKIFFDGIQAPMICTLKGQVSVIVPYSVAELAVHTRCRNPGSGVLQVNVTVPENAPAGAEIPLTLSVGGIASPAGTTIALK
jgi:hypothetical protein